MFDFHKHGIGEAAKAAKLISEGQTVSFDLWGVPDGFMKGHERYFIKTVYIGLCEFAAEKEGDNFALRCSNSPDLLAVNSFSLISSGWDEDVIKNPAYISAAIVQYMGAEKAKNYFINL